MKNKISKTMVIGLIILFVGASITSSIGAKITDIKSNDQVGMAPNWFESFDTYTDGQFLDGGSDDGGWKGWDNTPEAGAYVTSDYYRSPPYSVDIVGASDFVHEFEGYTSGVWNFTAWMYIPSDYEGSASFLMLDGYEDGVEESKHWSIFLDFDSFTGDVISENAGWTLPLITGDWIELLVVIDLDLDWFELYYNRELLEYKAWTAGWDDDNAGALDIACLDLFANSATSVYYDDISIVAYGTPAVPDLSVGGSLDWTDVTAGETVTGQFTVANGGFPGTALDWEIASFPDWGDWTFTPDSGNDLAGTTTVQVSVVAPGDANSEFTGTVTVVNKEDSSDTGTISVSLVTPKNKAIHSIFQQFFEQHPNIFPVLRHLLSL